MGTPIRIAVIAEQDTSMIEALSSSSEEMMVTGSFTDTEQLLSQAQYDICIVDMDLFNGSGIETLYSMSQRAPHMRIVAVVSSPEDIEACLLIANGATGIILRADIGSGLDHMIRTAIAGEFVMSREVFRQFISSVAKGQ